MSLRTRGSATIMLLAGLVGAVSLRAQDVPSDQPISLGDQPEYLGQLNRSPLQITGFGVGQYNYTGRTGDNTFSAGKLAVGLFSEITSGTYVYGQLTAALQEGVGGAEPATETEIDNLLVSVTPPGATNLTLELGKLDLPIGFERDDEPLNFLASPSFNFELSRPVKMVGLSGNLAVSPKLSLQGFVFNGWDSDLDPNHGKSVGGRIELLPGKGVILGASGLYGVEGDQGQTNDRYLIGFDYALEPAWNWILAGEANLGGDRGVLSNGGNAAWGGAQLTLVHQLTRHWGIVARAEVFRDADGARTGVAQTLESYSFAPLYSLGVGREGIFANVSHTTYRIPRLQLRGEVRVNHSDLAFFDTSSGPAQWNVEYRLQLVTTF